MYAQVPCGWLSLPDRFQFVNPQVGCFDDALAARRAQGAVLGVRDDDDRNVDSAVIRVDLEKSAVEENPEPDDPVQRIEAGRSRSVTTAGQNAAFAVIRQPRSRPGRCQFEPAAPAVGRQGASPTKTARARRGV